MTPQFGPRLAAGAGAVPFIPPPVVLWRLFRWWAWAVYVALILGALPAIVVDYWFLDSLQKSSIFWTNVGAQLGLFGLGTVSLAIATIVPLRRYAVSPELRTAAIHVGLWLGVFAGWVLSGRYLEFLLAYGRGSFGEIDPLFGHDAGFYVFVLPAIRVALTVLTWGAATGCVAALLGRYDQLRSAGIFDSKVGSPWSKLGMMATTGLNVCVLLFGSSLAARTFIGRYSLLFADNEASGVRAGAEYLDVEGVFSTVHLMYVSTVVEVGLVAAVCYVLYQVGRSSPEVGGTDDPAARTVRHRLKLRPAGTLALGLLGVELAFYLAVVVRDHVFVAPNEPSIQVAYIQRHMDATLRGYRLDRVRSVAWTLPEKALSVDELLSSTTVQNAPILPSWVSHLEQPPDMQHYERIRAAASTMVYGPMLQTYEQEQQLRPYYHFLSVDGVRYHVNGERRMYVSAVRELPSLAFRGHKEWLRYWGSAALMYTHGLGLVMSPVNELNAEGGPLYEVRDVPPAASNATFAVEPRIYFGEGAKDDYVLTGIRGLKEFDHATRQFRSEFVYPDDAADGIRIRSWFRRLVFSVYTKDVTAFLFSRFIDHDRTRVHIYRSPMRRVRRIAPFLFLDSNPYAFAADGRILWMVNGLTSTDGYPYSLREVLGDKADERAVEKFPERIINYAEDAVKVTVDAFSGAVHFYKIAGDPIIEAWSRVYPALFEPRSAMPAAVEAQLTYPLQWFHIQFDDIYKRYHQRDPIEFYNAEDLWDDADEVLGSIGRGLTEFGTMDQMTFSYEGYNLLLDPADLPPGSDAGKAGELQFALLMPFTPEGARNLRSVVLAFQDPGNYGELLNVRVPQGSFVPGPEQVDTFIDDDSQVNQQITLWVRHGAEVVRGHTLMLPVRGDIVYVEPLWIVSQQNQLPQIKLFSVVYRGRTTMATSLDQAIRLLAVPESEEQKANELPWFRDIGEVGTPKSSAPEGRRPQ